MRQNIFFNQNVACPLTQAYNNVYTQLLAHPTQRIFEREVVFVPPRAMYAPPIMHRQSRFIGMRTGNVMVRHHVPRVVAPEVLQAYAYYHKSRIHFLGSLNRLSKNYPYLMEQEKEQGLLPEHPPSRLSF
jgi:hypothetical protein